MKTIKKALVSVYNKSGLDEIIKKLIELNVQFYSTGGTKIFLEELGAKVIPVETLTGYPSILGGRVKTLHPKIFGGILARHNNTNDILEVKQYDIPTIDLVIVDLYPFEQTVASGATEPDIIEKIDIGGISLIRAAAKNFNEVCIISSQEQYKSFLELLNEKQGRTSLDDRKYYATLAFNVTSHYDTVIFNYFDQNQYTAFKQSITKQKKLRYGENPQQQGYFFGNFEDAFEQLHGKEISYNNLLDIDAAVGLIDEFNEPTFAIIKHNNACGLASRNTIIEAWNDALAGDPISAYGGVFIANKKIDKSCSEEINKIFFDIIIAPQYDSTALEILKQKKNRIIILRKNIKLPIMQYRSALNGVLVQQKDLCTETKNMMKVVTLKAPTENEYTDLEFANKIVKHSKSNAIVLAKNGQLIGSGVGQTSRIDALKQAIVKAQQFSFSLQGAVMASDAFFPFADCVEIAHIAGITAVIQPGGSVRDEESIAYCNKYNIAMVFTGNRHFKH